LSEKEERSLAPQTPLGMTTQKKTSPRRQFNRYGKPIITLP
jgi:hypothetical protein